MELRYSRNIPALTEKECALLRSKKIAVIGCGGLGGHIVELMARLGIGSIRAVDGDVFDPTNLNRQLLSRTETLGKGKAEAAADRVRSVNPQVEVEAAPVFLTRENAPALIRDCDAVMDALDNIPARRALAECCEDAGIPYIYGAIQGWVAQAAVSLPGDGLIRTLYPAEIAITEKSVLSFTPALCASLQCALCTRLLVNRPVQTGKVYYFDLLDMEFETIPFA